MWKSIASQPSISLSLSSYFFEHKLKNFNKNIGNLVDNSNELFHYQSHQETIKQDT